jgi:hypothetical protein
MIDQMVSLGPKMTRIFVFVLMQIALTKIGLGPVKRVWIDALHRKAVTGRLSCANQENVMQNNIASAYGWLQDIASKRSDLTDKSNLVKQEYLKLLVPDLLSIEFDDQSLSDNDILENLIKVNSLWNKQTQQTIYSIYRCREKDHLQRAEDIKQEFLDKCPSSWYKNIVNDV